MTFHYQPVYESPLIRGKDEPRPWDLHALIQDRLTPDSLLLDIGCGTAFKSIKLAPFARRVIGLEPNQQMLERALQNRIQHKIKNLEFVGGIADYLPFADNTFDVVTVMLAPHNAQEIYRVLKPGGSVIIETIGEQDKYALKREFGQDEKGWRGQYMHLTKGAITQQAQQDFNPLFKDITIQNGFWKTYYTEEGLQFLLLYTPTVRNFHEIYDRENIKRVKQKYATSQGTMAVQHRVLIMARK